MGETKSPNAYEIFSEDDSEFLKLLLHSISSTHYALFKSALKLLMTIFNQRRRLFHVLEKVISVPVCNNNIKGVFPI